MYVNPKQKRKTLFINTIVILSMLGMVAGVYYGINFFTHASKSVQPENVIVSNILGSSVVISWQTDEAVIGSVKLEDGRVFTDDRGLVSSKYHYVTINKLEPNKLYNYKLISGDNESSVDILGSQLQFKTFAIRNSEPMITNLSGQVKANSLIIAYIHNNFFSGLSTSQGDFNLKLINYDNIPFSLSDDMSLFVIYPNGKMRYAHAAYGALFDESQNFIGLKKLVDTAGSELTLLSKKTGEVANYKETEEVQRSQSDVTNNNKSETDVGSFSVNNNQTYSNSEESSNKLILHPREQADANTSNSEDKSPEQNIDNSDSNSTQTEEHLKLKQL